MSRRLLYLCLLFAALFTAAPVGLVRPDNHACADTKECTVYVTRTGIRYHRPTCSSLRYSRRAMTRSDAIAAGYTPCKRCGGSECD
jgi:hypothetical protein